MLISDSHRFIFVHVRKTGGSSMREALKQYAIPAAKGKALKLASYVGLVRDYRRFPFGLHASLASCQRLMPPAQFAECFKFGFVRNPWDRLASEYRFILGSPRHRRHKRVAAMGGIAEFLNYQRTREKGSQLEMLRRRDGELGVDFVGRFESLEADFGRACELIGIKPAGSLAHLNRGTGGDYRAMYDRRSVQLVARFWADEIEAFGYEFEG